jgi:hypothetical protein
MQNEIERSELLRELGAAIHELVEEGRVVDSGRRKRSKISGRPQIVWTIADREKTLH